MQPISTETNRIKETTKEQVGLCVSQGGGQHRGKVCSSPGCGRSGTQYHLLYLVNVTLTEPCTAPCAADPVSAVPLEGVTCLSGAADHCIDCMMCPSYITDNLHNLTGDHTALHAADTVSAVPLEGVTCLSGALTTELSSLKISMPPQIHRPWLCVTLTEVSSPCACCRSVP